MVAALLLPPATGSVSAAAEPAGVTWRFRIGVVRDGITMITPADLSGAGVDPVSIDPRSFAMSSLGQPVAIYVTGEADGRFDPEDRVYFFGEKFRSTNEMEQKYTDERVYWLAVGGAAGPRMATVDAAPVGDLTAPADFATTVRAEESNVWWTLYTLNLDTQDTWFWVRQQPFGSLPVTATLPYVIPYPNDGPATLRLEEISNSYSFYVNPDHRTVASLNGTQVFDKTWDGLRVRQVLTGTVPAGVLKHGANNLDVGAWLVQNVASDDIYVNYWELAYRRLFRAFDDRIDFQAETNGAQEYAVAGWTDSNVMAWDISNPLVPVRLNGGAVSASTASASTVSASTASAATASASAASAATASASTSGAPEVRLPVYGVTAPATQAKDAAVSVPLGSGPVNYTPAITAASREPAAPGSDYTVRFRVNTSLGNRYWLQGENAAQAPASFRLRLPTGLRTPLDGADAVIVTSAALRPQAERLAKWHRQHGRRTIVVDIQDAYDEFNDGIFHPKAVQNMMKWAAANWPKPAPMYLTLFGDGHWNFKNYNPAAYPAGANHIPPYLVWVDPWQGEVPADSRFGDINGDTLPEVAVGRIVVDTLDEAAVVVDKIINYDEGKRVADWQHRAIFASDNADGAGDFPAVSDAAIARLTPSDFVSTRVYLPPNPVSSDQIAATKAALLSALDSGAAMVQYTGHGAPERWAGEPLLTTTDVALLTNGSRLPVVMTFNCLDGYFAHPTRISMAETMLRLPNGGSIAAISPTGLGTTQDQQAFREMLLNVIFKDHVRDLGRALMITKRKFGQVYGLHYLTQTVTLFGDPAMKMAGDDSFKTYLPSLSR